MPYITADQKNLVKRSGPHTSGQLNYAVTAICLKYLDNVGGAGHYNLLNDVVGALECAKAEFYRRLVSPYEDIKAHDNGDVYE